jgi:predicted transcriptional regulator
MVGMADTVTLSLDPETAEQLRRVAAESGESLESIAERVLAEAAAGLAGEEIEDPDLTRRIDAWQGARESVPSDEVHAYLRSLLTDNPLPRPTARR